jgi:hypothetical protein
VIGRLSGGPCRHGVAVISIDGLPGASRTWVAQGSRPTALPPSEAAPTVVVTTVPADGSMALPRSSRLSA